MSDNEWLKAKRNVDAALHTPTNSLAEITRLRDHAAGLALERDGFQEECKRLRADLAAAQEREQRMREATLHAKDSMTGGMKVLEAQGLEDGYAYAALRLAIKHVDAALGEPQ